MTSELTRFILLYAAMYAAFGVASPFLPPFSAPGGCRPSSLGSCSRRHGRAIAHGAARRPHRRLDPGAPRRARRLHRACRRGDVGLSRGARILDFAWDEPAACRVAGADYHLGRRIGARSLLLRRRAAVAGASSMDGCAAPARLPSSSALCCPGRR